MLDIKYGMKLMNRAVRRAKDTLLQEGTLFPTLILYKQGSAFDADVEKIQKKEGVVHVVNSSNIRLNVSDDFITDEGEEIYTLFVLFKYDENTDERDINRVAKELTREYNPDMVGLVMACLYAEKKPSDPEIYLNPEATRLLHSVFYRPGSEDGRAIFLPYVNRGELPLSEQTYNPDPQEDSVKYDMHFVESAWTPTSFADIRPSIENPYPRS